MASLVSSTGRRAVVEGTEAAGTHAEEAAVERAGVFCCSTERAAGAEAAGLHTEVGALERAAAFGCSAGLAAGAEYSAREAASRELAGLETVRETSG